MVRLRRHAARPGPPDPPGSDPRLACSACPCLRTWSQRIEEARSKFRGRQPAHVQSSEPGITMSGDPVVDEVTRRFRYQHQHPAERPRQSKPACNPKRRSRARADTAVFHEHQCRHLVWNRVCLQNAPTRLALEGREGEMRVLVPVDDEQHEPVAQITDAVEQDHRSLGPAPGRPRGRGRSHNPSDLFCRDVGVMDVRWSVL